MRCSINKRAVASLVAAALLFSLMILMSFTARAAELPPASLSANQKAALADMPMLRLTPDKPQTILLERDAVNVLIGNDTHLHIIPDTSRNLILMPRAPGTTYFTVLDANGGVIMQRHVVVAAPKRDYIRIRRACPAGDRDCVPYSMYYCPDICHEMAVPLAYSAGKAEQLSPPDEVASAPVNDLSVEDGVAPEDIAPPPPSFVPSAQVQEDAAAINGSAR